MDEVEPGLASVALSPDSAGSLLMTARNGAGLSLAEVGARTRIPLRHLEAIETGVYTELPSPTYAVGFAKAYARAVGADEVAISAIVRQEVAKLGRRQPEYTPYEIADPSRVPSRGVAVVGLGIAVAVLILIGLWYGTGLFRGGAGRPAVPAAAFTPAVAAPAPAPTAAPAPGAGQVTLLATGEVPVRVQDAAGKTLFDATMNAGDHFDVPADAADPRIDVGRPDRLGVTLNGSAVPPLGRGDAAVKGVAISAAALLARASGSPLPVASPAAGATSVPSAAPSATAAAPKPAADKRIAAAKRATPSRSKRPRRQLSETQRANLQSAANPPPAAPIDTP